MEDWKRDLETRDQVPAETSPWICRRCHLLNQGTATYCDCGYNRKTGESVDVRVIEEAKFTQAEGTRGNPITRIRRRWRRAARFSPYGLTSCVLGFLLLLPASCNTLTIAAVMTESGQPGATAFAQTEVLSIDIWMNFLFAAGALVGLILAVIGMWHRERLRSYSAVGIFMCILVIALFPAAILAMRGH